jgi:hypothetical protein
MVDITFCPKILLFMEDMSRTVFRAKCDELKGRLDVTIGKSTYAFMALNFLGIIVGSSFLLNVIKI